jgi:hypothetical protein
MTSNPYQSPQTDTRDPAPQRPRPRVRRSWPGLLLFLAGLVVLTGGHALFAWALDTLGGHWFTLVAAATMWLGILMVLAAFAWAVATTVTRLLGPGPRKTKHNDEPTRRS